MANTYVFARGAWLGASGLPDFTSDAERTAYLDYIDDELEKYDDTLCWLPTFSEVWGQTGSTKSDPDDFRRWWDSGVRENALTYARSRTEEVRHA